MSDHEKPQWQKDLDAVLEPVGWEPPSEVTPEEFLVLVAAPPGGAASALEDYYDRKAGEILDRANERKASQEAAREAAPETHKAKAREATATTLAEAFAEGVDAGAEAISSCCGCSGSGMSVTNPYDNEEVSL